LRIYVAIDEPHVALPKLYGAPAYARPNIPVEVTPRPLDPDDLPIEAFRTDEDQEIAETLPEYGYTSGAAQATGRPTANQATSANRRPQLQPRPLSLKAIAGRIRGEES
jgi:hypothetical protein